MLMTPLPVHGSLSELRLWWDKLLQFGPAFGYFPNPSKICLVVKESFYDAAVEMFQGSGISITVDGKRHLGVHLVHLTLSLLLSRKGSLPGLRSWIYFLTFLLSIFMLHMQPSLMALLASGTI